MIDPKLLRDEPDRLRAGLAKKRTQVDLDHLIELDARRRELQARVEGMRSGEGLAVDPVCRMVVDPDRGAGSLTHEGVSYQFCSLRCAGAFASDPGRYAVREAGSPRG